MLYWDVLNKIFDYAVQSGPEDIMNIRSINRRTWYNEKYKEMYIHACLREKGITQHLSDLADNRLILNAAGDYEIMEDLRGQIRITGNNIKLIGNNYKLHNSVLSPVVIYRADNVALEHITMNIDRSKIIKDHTFAYQSQKTSIFDATINFVFVFDGGDIYIS